MKLSELLSKPFKLKGGGILNLKGFSKRVIDNEIGGGGSDSDSESINVVEAIKSSGFIPQTFSSLEQFIQDIINKSLEHKYEYVLGTLCKLPDYLSYDNIAIDVYDKENNKLLFTEFLVKGRNVIISGETYYRYNPAVYKINEEYYDISGIMNLMPKAPDLMFAFYSKKNAVL